MGQALLRAGVLYRRARSGAMLVSSDRVVVGTGQVVLVVDTVERMRDQRQGAAAGFVALALGVGGASFERGAPGVGAPPEQVAAFFVEYRTELLVQSLLMVLSLGALLWFLAGVRSVLGRAEGGSGQLTAVFFGAGLVGFGLQAAIQAPQSALAMASNEPFDPQLAAMMSDLGSALAVVAYVPMGVMLAAFAVVILRTGALPRWLGWLSVGAAVAYLSLSTGIAVDGGPVARGAWTTFVPYTLTVVWLAATSTLMLKARGARSKPAPVAVRGSGTRRRAER